MASSVEDLCNQALRRIGYATPIGNIYEGSPASRVAIEVYGQTRDDLLRGKDWTFARRFATAVASAYSPQGAWSYQYQWPADCLRLRSVMPTLTAGVQMNPQPVVFDDYNDQRSSPAAKAILTNQSAATLVYTAQVTDMTTWDPNFTEAVVEALARRFVMEFGKPDQLKPQVELTDMAVGTAQGAQTNQAPATVMPFEQRGRQ